MTTDLEKKAAPVVESGLRAEPAIAAAVLDISTEIPTDAAAPPAGALVGHSDPILEVKEFLHTVAVPDDAALQDATVRTLATAVPAESAAMDPPVHAGGAKFTAYEAESLYTDFDGFASATESEADDVAARHTAGPALPGAEFLDSAALDLGFELPDIDIAPDILMS